MPAIVSHYLLAEKVRTALKEQKPHLALNPIAFLSSAITAPKGAQSACYCL